ncbi:MAG: PepSY domain-containing protein [Hyphomicrobiaceae bacterium]|nr:PepSY domain-containing protein [Hyphomicrobiaceae bacterium]
MLTKIAVVALALAVSAPVPGGVASAQVLPQAAQERGMISAEQAIEIARRHGLVNVEEIDLDDGKWEVEGRDAQNREIEVEIDVRTGQVVDIDRD